MDRHPHEHEAALCGALLSLLEKRAPEVRRHILRECPVCLARCQDLATRPEERKKAEERCLNVSEFHSLVRGAPSDALAGRATWHLAKCERCAGAFADEAAFLARYARPEETAAGPVFAPRTAERQACPEPASLVALADGTLPKPTSRIVLDHITTCKECLDEAIAITEAVPESVTVRVPEKER